mmetsp:Transcript_6030/g.12322  ORF Transcript_6030/g.12322 Transcript_6030/m.12322 type:complete len:263 (+) Transcript_6030:3-791(+)
MGGSSANFSQSSAFTKFLQSRGICPRRLKGTCIIPYGNKVTVAYINSEGNAMFFHYSNPVHGGKIKTISMSVLNKYPFLQVFAECKIYTALLLRRLNQMKAFTIVPTAVRCELAVLKECQDKLNLSKEYNGHDNFRSQLLKEFSLWYSFTVVLHPVGYHQDNFGAKTVSGYDTNSLENKICFRTKGFGKDFYGCGRYGAGESYCCFALLDWGGSTNSSVNADDGEDPNGDPHEVQPPLFIPQLPLDVGTNLEGIYIGGLSNV